MLSSYEKNDNGLILFTLTQLCSLFYDTALYLENLTKYGENEE